MGGGDLYTRAEIDLIVWKEIDSKRRCVKTFSPPHVRFSSSPFFSAYNPDIP